MDSITGPYAALLHSVDEWFARVATQCGSAVSCRSGCSECCRGLFDITLLDAFYLKRGFEQLPFREREAVTARAQDRLLLLQSIWPEFSAPYLLNNRPEEDWEQLMPEEDETACVLLGSDGRCLVYEHRPMTCRLHGIPLVDDSGEVMFDEWCSLNFVGGNPLEGGLNWRFRKVFQDELILFRQFTEKLIGFPLNELDTLIPTGLLIDFECESWETVRNGL